MTEHFNLIAIAVVLLFLALLSWWLPTALTPRTSLFTGESRHDPDYIIDNFVATEMNPQGKPKHELRASILVHFSDDDTSELTRPTLVQYSADSAPVHTRADHGLVTPDGKQILMRGNVRVWRGNSGTDPGGDVQTEEMRVILE